MQIALARHAAGPDGDLRLADVPSRAERIVLWIQKGQHTPLLVIVQELPDDRNRSSNCGAGRQDPPPGKASEEQKAGPVHRKNDGGAEIGLLEHECGGNSDHHQGHQKPQRLGYLLHIQPMKIARKREHERDLHQLRGL